MKIPVAGVFTPSQMQDKESLGTAVEDIPEPDTLVIIDNGLVFRGGRMPKCKMWARHRRWHQPYGPKVCDCLPKVKTKQ